MNQIIEQKTNEILLACAGRFFTVKKFAEINEKQGTWPDSESKIWALRAGSPENGFGDAFITIGRRVLINEEKFLEAVSYRKKT